MRLRYTPEAVTELASVPDGITDRSPQGALRVQSRILKTINLLTNIPTAASARVIRHCGASWCGPIPNLIFYRVADAEVVIIGVRHAARDRASMPDAL